MDKTLLATIVLGCLGFIITAYYSWHAKKIAHEQMLKQLFVEFNRRYDALNGYLAEIEKKYPTLEMLETSEKSEELKQKIIDYFSLCAEEFFWYHHKKRIDDIIWNSWQAGMNYWYNNVPAIRSLWKIEIKTNGKESYYITSDIEFFKPETDHE